MSDDKPSSAPVIPSPPRREAARPKHRRRRSRGPAFLLALVLGAALGVVSHRYLEPVTELVDYWVALALA